MVTLKKGILFLCTGNSCCSQMAEANKKAKPTIILEVWLFNDMYLFNFPQLYLHSGELFLHLRKTQRIILSVLLI